MRELSPGETLIMKAIWEAGEDIFVPELMEVMRRKYEKDYRRTTVGTFLLRLSDKRFLTTYREGRFAYVHALVSKEEFEQKLAGKTVDFWFKGKLSNYIAAFCAGRELSEEELTEIQRVLEGIENGREK